MQVLKVLLIFLVVLLSSCSIKESKYPTINFIGGKDIVDQDVVVKPGETFRMGINAHSNSDYDIYKFKLFRISNNISEIVIDSTINNKVYNAVLTLPSAENDCVERWVLSVTCEDGYTSEISAQITTSDTLKYVEPSVTIPIGYVLTDLPNTKKDMELYLIVSILIIIFVLYLYSKKRNHMKIVVYNPNKYRGIKKFFKMLFLTILAIILFTFLLFLNFLVI